MKTDSKKYAQDAYKIVEHAANEIGSRLPGSEGERKFAHYMGEKLEEIGIKSVKEEFAVSPRSGIGGLPYAGWAGFILSVLAFVARDLTSLWYALGVFAALMLIWLVGCVFLYNTWFDLFFKQKISQNVYGELLPEDGKYDYTIILSGHTDTSWNWKHSENTYNYRDKPILGLIKVYAKVGFGAVCVFAICLISIFMAVLVFAGLELEVPWAIDIFYSKWFNVFYRIMAFLPAVTAFGSWFVIMWGDPSEENASRGAMDNTTGCALSYQVIKYFKENPDKMPKNCRIIDFNCGSEEAGLRGSIQFTKDHKNDGLLENAYNINIDSIADKDYFEVVIKDDWQFTRFDTDLEKMFKDTFKELEIESKTGGCIHNPVGGCDSTPMTKAGIKSVTFAAQNPMLTYYYHTFRDVPERFEVETLETGFDVILGVIDKIALHQETVGFNGVNKKVQK